MKTKVLLILCFSLTSMFTIAQVGRDPSGVKSGRENGGGKQNGGGNTDKDKPGKNSVSPSAKETAKGIKDANSADGNGKHMTGLQRNEAERQLKDAQTKAAAEGRKADAAFLGKEKDRVKGGKK